MTRNQAEKIASRIVKLAESTAPADAKATWTAVEIEITADDARAIDENGGLIVGCMPMGYRLAGARGSTNVTVRRAPR